MQCGSDMDERVSTPSRARFRVLDLEIDLARQQVRLSGQLLDLPDLSFRLLVVLVNHAPDTISKDELISEVWGEVVVGDETLAQRVRLLRQALGDDGQDPRYFSSVRGRGYRLICPVNELSPELKRATVRNWWLTAAGIVVVLIASIWFFSPELEKAAAPLGPNSIAVLPFEDLSPDRQHAYFADGMQEELLSRLTKLESLEVSSRTSVEQYRSTNLSLPIIAEQIGVRLVIEGSVRIAGDRVRITVQLIDAQTDLHLWAENFDRELSVPNIFFIQQEVAGQIAQALELKYPPDKTLESLQLPTASLDAYNAFLLGRHHTFRQTPEDLSLAVGYLEEATRLDPEFAQAHASLGWAYSFQGTTYGGKPPVEVYPLAQQSALRALSLNSEMSDARTLYADILTWFDWDFVAAEREYINTVNLDPNNILGYALFLSTQIRHDEAIGLIERRLEFSPNDPYVHINAAWRYFDARQYQRAIEEAGFAENHADANAVMGLAYMSLGETARAVSIFQQDLLKRNREPQQLSNLAVAYWKDNRGIEAEELLLELQLVRKMQFVSPALVAAVYFAAEDFDNGFILLREAVEVRAREVIFLQVNPMLDDLRDDPRYLELIQSIGFRQIL